MAEKTTVEQIKEYANKLPETLSEQKKWLLDNAQTLIDNSKGLIIKDGKFDATGLKDWLSQSTDSLSGQFNKTYKTLRDNGAPILEETGDWLGKNWPMLAAIAAPVLAGNFFELGPIVTLLLGAVGLGAAAYFSEEGSMLKQGMELIGLGPKPPAKDKTAPAPMAPEKEQEKKNENEGAVAKKQTIEPDAGNPAPPAPSTPAAPLTPAEPSVADASTPATPSTQMAPGEHNLLLPKKGGAEVDFKNVELAVGTKNVVLLGDRHLVLEEDNKKRLSSNAIFDRFAIIGDNGKIGAPIELPEKIRAKITDAKLENGAYTTATTVNLDDAAVIAKMKNAYADRMRAIALAAPTLAPLPEYEELSLNNAERLKELTALDKKTEALMNAEQAVVNGKFTIEIEESSREFPNQRLIRVLAPSTGSGESPVMRIFRGKLIENDLTIDKVIISDLPHDKEMDIRPVIFRNVTEYGGTLDIDMLLDATGKNTAKESVTFKNLIKNSSPINRDQATQAEDIGQLPSPERPIPPPDDVQELDR